MHTENLIVGLGIAGINLCHQLQLQGRSFIVVDDCPARSSTLIAGGIYNPIVIKRKVKTWKADKLFPFLVETYREMEQVLGTQILHHDFPILKPISSAQEMEEWQSAIDAGLLAPFVQEVVREIPHGPFQPKVLGYVLIKQAGFLRTDEAVGAYRHHLRNRNAMLEETFDFNELEINDDGVRYRDMTADRVIFCEGRFIDRNPFFNWLPMRPTKGQMVTVSVNPKLAPDHVYNQQFYLFPTRQEGQFRLGATYEWNDLSEEPTDEAGLELTSRVQKALDIEMKILDRQAAIRPNVADRRPLIGQHPEIPSMFLLNGMGSKGVMLAPYFAKQLVDFVYNDGALHSEADLGRFIKRFRNRDN